LDHTILEILNYSRNARLDITWSAFNLRSYIQDILTDLQSMRLDVITEVIWSGEEQVHLDEVRVGVLLNNLLSNAIKYSKRGQDDAKVRVRVETTPEECLIAIEDNGEGIEEAHLNSVFDMFFRASNSSPGTGLGLYICKEITDKLGGDIVLTSEKGIGTTVTTTLPQIEHGQIPSD
jgi:signal transduction histidine kinase